MKRIIKIVFLSLLFCGTMFILVAANQKVKEQIMERPIINLTAQDEIPLLTEQELLEKLYVLQLYKDGIKKSDLQISEIETKIRKMNEVLDADVYVELDGRWHIDLITRRPIARILQNGINDFYVDNNYQLMKLSPYAKPKVIVFTGFDKMFESDSEFEEIINNDSLKTKLKMNQIYNISNYVCKDTFYNAQLVQIHYTLDDGFILIPRAGNHKIIFGDAESKKIVEEKFDKLTTFYNEVIPYEGWDKYELINLKFKGQIVAKKRD